MAPSELLHGCTATFQAHADVEVPDCLQKLRHGHAGIALSETQSALNLTDHLKAPGFHAVVQKSIVADLLVTCGQYMHQVTADEYRVCQSNLAFGASRLYPSGREGDLIF